MKMLSNFTLKGSKKFNEDVSLSRKIQAPDNHHLNSPPYVFVLNVSDGHGTDGEGFECASFCTEQIEPWINTLYTKDWSEIDWVSESTLFTAQLHDGYRIKCASYQGRYIDENGVVRCSEALDRGKAIHSGTTFSVVIVFPWNDKYKTVCIQVSDSDIFINGKMVECDHSPLSKTEYMRLKSVPIEKRLKLVYQNRNRSLVFKDDDYDPEYYNNGWNWDKLSPSNMKYTPGAYAQNVSEDQDETSIATVRSIGDYYAHVYGLTTIPYVEIFEFDVCPTVVIGSDGAWDTINTENKWVGKNFSLDVKDIKATEIETIVKNLNSLYSEFFGRGVADDISIAVLI